MQKYKSFFSFKIVLTYCFVCETFSDRYFSKRNVNAVISITVRSGVPIQLLRLKFESSVVKNCA